MLSISFYLSIYLFIYLSLCLSVYHVSLPTSLCITFHCSLCKQASPWGQGRQPRAEIKSLQFALSAMSGGNTLVQFGSQAHAWNGRTEAMWFTTLPEFWPCVGGRAGCSELQFKEPEDEKSKNVVDRQKLLLQLSFLVHSFIITMDLSIRIN
jgi:hypothetical protein